MNIATTLRDAGLKATSQRERVVAVLTREKLPVAPQELVVKLKMDAVTVYRALEDLATAGVVRRTDFRHGHAEYELEIGRPHHHHIVCTSCGTVEDIVGIPEKGIEKRAIARSEKFKNITSHALELFGLCMRCA